MENTNNNKRFIWSLVGAVVVVIIIFVALRFGGANNQPTDLDTDGSTASSTDMTGTSTDMTGSTTGSVTGPTITPSTPTTGPSISAGSVTNGPQLAYALNTNGMTFRQGDQIKMDLMVLNLGKTSEKLSFKDGCLASYTIGDFDSAKHTSCIQTPTSFTIAPGEVKDISLVHYPAVYKIPVGTYTLHASVVGYGGQSVQIKIVQ